MLNRALEMIRDNWDSHDPWGSGMQALGDVADVMHAAGVEIPPELEFSPAMGQSETIAELAESDDPYVPYNVSVLANEYQMGNVDAHTLTLAALTLNRYVDACRAAGLNY